MYRDLSIALAGEFGKTSDGNDNAEVDASVSMPIEK